MSASAWTWGAYKRGMGLDPPFNDRRIKHAVFAIKRELAYLGYTGLNLDSPLYGSGAYAAVREFQLGAGLEVDGMAGQQTCNALWRPRIESLDIPGGWLRAQIHWESLDDPGAELVNSDGSADRALCQLNSTRKPATEAEAFDPAYSIPYLAAFLKDSLRRYKDCEVEPIRLAVGRWRTPVGADYWCDHPEIVPSKDGGTSPKGWGQRAAYYADRVDTHGRGGWA